MSDLVMPVQLYKEAIKNGYLPELTATQKAEARKHNNELIKALQNPKPGSGQITEVAE